MRLVGIVQHDHLPADNRLVRLRAREGLSRLFDAEAEFACDDPDLDLEAVLWSTVLLRVDDLDGGAPLFVHGVIEAAEYLHARGQKHLYRLRVRPEVHGLAYRVRSRIFQNLDVRAIVEAVLAGAGIPPEHVEWHVTAKYLKREYCVQYKESELDFVLRLLEDEGIFYWFEHTEAGHTLKLGDSPTNHEPVAGERVLPLCPFDQVDREALTDAVLTTQVTHDRHRTRDWNFAKTEKPLEGDQHADGDWHSQYQYPGGFQSSADGGRRAHNRLHEALVPRWELNARGNTPRLRPGHLFDLAGAQPGYMNREYLLLDVEHAYTDTGYESAGQQIYRAALRAMPSATEFRPARTTPRPRAWGKETAVVTGPSGEEIHVDDMGRVKVHLYWDREGRVDDTATCWMRVQQLNTGGAMVLPRVGWEVSVGFLDGDPDRPVVLQKLYNQETMPPYGLPGNKTQSSLQSSTSPGGGSTNEIRLQDGNGGMEFSVHASKDYQMTAGANHSEDVGVNAKHESGLGTTEGVAGSETVSVGANQSTSVVGSARLGTGGAKTVAVAAVDDWGITGGLSLICTGARTENIGGLMNVLANKVAETFKAGCTRTVGAAQIISSATSIVESVGGSKTETVGAAKIELLGKAHGEQVKANKTLLSGAVLEKTGTDIAVSAKGALAISVGGPIAEKVGGEWSLGAAGVLITTGMLDLKCGGSTLSAKGGKITIKGSNLGASGGPTLTLKGTINYKP